MATVILPYRTDWQELLRVMEYAKGTGADRASLDSRFGGGESLRETLNALEQLALVERDDSGSVRLSLLGNRIAYAADSQSQRQIVIQVLLGYLPYRIPLERAVVEEREVLEGPWLENVWQVDMNLNQPRNRVEEARTFFFRLIDDATGFGVYRRGVRGQVTRLEFADRSLETISAVLGLDGKQNEQPDAAAPDELAGAPAVPGPAGSEASPLAEASPATIPGNIQLSIQVDMSDWELERIVEFLRLVGYPTKDSAG